MADEATTLPASAPAATQPLFTRLDCAEVLHLDPDGAHPMLRYAWLHPLLLVFSWLVRSFHPHAAAHSRSETRSPRVERVAATTGAKP